AGAARRVEADRRDLRLGPGAARRRPDATRGPARRPHRRTVRGARAPPQHRTRAGPLPGAPQKPLTCPPAEERRFPRPCPYSHHLAMRLRNRAKPGMSARGAFPAAGWTPATSSFVMPPYTGAARRSRSALACSPAKASSPGAARWPPWPWPRRRSPRRQGVALMPAATTSKVTAVHLSRPALLYIRQSTLKQVVHNTESAVRQYDLRGKAIALGWTADQVTVIDIDQGHSGASAADREGFQHLVAEVSLGRAGIVLGLECSRLARNSADWHQLLELCGMTGTLICDEDGLYDPRDFNDRLVLGMKGQISEAELHFIRARLRGGVLSK